MSKPEILERIEAMGYVAFDNGDYDINIIGLEFF